MFICRFCGKEFEKKFSWTQHEKYYCKQNENRVAIACNSRYINHKKCTCRYCGRAIDVANIARHEQAHTTADSKCNKIRYTVDHEGLNCKYCGKLCKHKNSLAQHELRCKENPNRKAFDSLGNYSHTYIAGKTKETSEQIAKQAQLLKELYTSGKLKVTNKPFCSAIFKYGWYKNVWCDSSWELAFLIYMLETGNTVDRCNIPIPYLDEENNYHTYYPDFVVNNKDIYEIKGRLKQEDLLKLKAAAEQGYKITLVDSEAIKPYLDYCISKYGKNFYSLYDSDKPSCNT